MRKETPAAMPAVLFSEYVLASLALGRRFSRDANLAELKWMAPFSLAGAVIGVVLLILIGLSLLARVAR